MTDTRNPLEPLKFYHIYNRAVGNELLFKTDNNYLHFLNLLKKYLEAYIDIYAYCLMPNHFHLLIKINDEKEIIANYIKQNSSKHFKNTESTLDCSLILSRQFSHLFNSYAQAYNKENKRKGSLFINRFKRKPINEKKYLLKVIHYIHFNPVLAKLCTRVDDWKYSSYNAIMGSNYTLIMRKNVFKLFEDKSNFIYCHNKEPQITGID